MPLIIGYGNTLRSDDGVGPKGVEAVAALQWPGVRTMSCDLLTPELADPVAAARAVVFVDAALDAPREVLLRPLAPADSSQLMAHAADPRSILALARDVFGHAPPAWWLTIPIENTAIGEEDIHRLFGARAHLAPLSATVLSAASVAEIALDMLNSGRETGPDSLSPLYIRRPEAELAWEKRQRSG